MSHQIILRDHVAKEEFSHPTQLAIIDKYTNNVFKTFMESHYVNSSILVMLFTEFIKLYSHRMKAFTDSCQLHQSLVAPLNIYGSCVFPLLYFA